jgi:hypothetical protein
MIEVVVEEMQQAAGDVPKTQSKYEPEHYPTITKEVVWK